MSTLAVVEAFARRIRGASVEVNEATELFSGGLGLDSLETAELSALLEDEYGTDPFTAGQQVNTVGEIASFYDAAGS